MNYICKKHNPPIRWVVSDDSPPGAAEFAKTCACGETGEVNTAPPEPQQRKKTGIELACSLLERWYGTPTQDSALLADTHDFLIGSSG